MVPTQPLWTDIVNSIAGAISALGSVITAVTAIIAGYIAWKKFIKEESMTATPNRLTIFDWAKQTAELRATEKGLEYYLYDIRPDHEKGSFWTIPVDQLEESKNEISVYPSKDHSEWGLFSIGRKTDWYYSKKLFKTENDLKNAIRDLIDRSLNMAKKAE